MGIVIVDKDYCFKISKAILILIFKNVPCLSLLEDIHGSTAVFCPSQINASILPLPFI